MNLKDVRKLQERKYREETGMFFVEGRKNILELIHSPFTIHTIFATEKALPEFERALRARGSHPEIITAHEDALAQAGTLTTNEDGIAVSVMKNTTTDVTDLVRDRARHGLVLMLDTVNDPGNLGTIIRTADWFGVTTLILSRETVDVYNPKVLRSTMGSFTRVDTYVAELSTLLSTLKADGIPIYGAVLTGTPLTTPLTAPPHGVILLGSESHGIHPHLEPFITHPITIPQRGNAESLNVGVAAGIILAYFTSGSHN